MKTIWDVIDVNNGSVLAMNVEGTLEARRLRDLFTRQGTPAALRHPRDERTDLYSLLEEQQPRVKVTQGITAESADERIGAWNRLRAGWAAEAEAEAAASRQWAWAIGESR